MIEKCVETTKNTPEDEFNSLPDKDLLAKEVKDLSLYDDTHIENDQKIDYLKKLESAASNDKKIVNTESSFTQNKSNFILANSEGFCNGYKTKVREARKNRLYVHWRNADGVDCKTIGPASQCFCGCRFKNHAFDNV